MECRGNKSKKKINKSDSPKQTKSNIDKKDNRSVGKENNCMNKINSDEYTKENSKGSHRTNKSLPHAKMKTEEAHPSNDFKHQDSAVASDECKEVEDFKDFLKNCCRSKRRVLLKPNLPIKWIKDLKAKLANIQAK